MNVNIYKIYERKCLMAKKNNSFIVGILGALASLMVLGAVTRGFEEWDVSKWFGDDSSSTDTEVSDSVSEDVSTSVTPVLKVSPITDIDYASCSQSTALDGQTGASLITGYPNMWISYYLSVTGNTSIEFSSEPYKVIYYTADLQFIKQDKFVTATTMTKVYSVPENASYLRFQYCVDNTYPTPAIKYEDRSLITIKYL